MSELTTAARPYAKAVFELARQDGNYASWSDQLQFLAAVADDPSMSGLLDNPQLTRDALGELMNAIGEGKLDGGGKNLVRLLAENRRLKLLPAIAPLFEDMRSLAEQKVDATVIAAQPVSDTQHKAIVAALKKRFDRDVELSCEVDESLIGGAVIRAGDMVIDGSVTGRLQQLAGSLRH